MSHKVQPLSPEHAPDILCPELQPVAEVHRNSWFSVVDRGSYFVVEYDNPQVVILPVVDRQHIVTVRVHRPVIGDTPLELPAGGSWDDETPHQAAQRELYEETGIQLSLDRFSPILPISEQPGRSPVLLSVFKADLTMEEFCNRKPSDHEIATVELLSYEDVINKICSGEIYIASPMAIMLRFILSEYKQNGNGEII